MLERELHPSESCDPGKAQCRRLFDNQPPSVGTLRDHPGSTGLHSLRRGAGDRLPPGDTNPLTFCWHLGHTHTPLGAVLRGGSRQPRW